MAVIAVDFDGTLADTITPWLKSINTFTGLYKGIDDITEWRFGPLVGVKDPFKFLNADVVSEALPHRYILTAVRALYYDGGHSFVCLTANRYEDAVKAWLKNWLPDIEIPYQFAQNKTEVEGIDLLIDDAPHNFNEASKGILIDRPWNQRPFDNHQDQPRRVWCCFENQILLIANHILSLGREE